MVEGINYLLLNTKTSHISSCITKTFYGDFPVKNILGVKSCRPSLNLLKLGPRKLFPQPLWKGDLIAVAEGGGEFT